MEGTAGGGGIEQKIELNGEEISNAITSVNKDSLVMELSFPKGAECGENASEDGEYKEAGTE